MENIFTAEELEEIREYKRKQDKAYRETHKDQYRIYRQRYLLKKAREAKAEGGGSK